MTLPTYVTTGGHVTGTAGTTLAWPGSTQVDDAVVLVIEHADEAGGHPTPSNGGGGYENWVELGTTVTQDGVMLTCWLTYVTGTLGTCTISDSGNHTQSRAIAIRHVDGRPEVHLMATGTDPTSDTSGQMPAMTTTVDDCFIVICAAGDLPDSTGTAEYTVDSYGNLASGTKRADNSVTSGNGGSKLVATGTLASQGSVGTITYTKANAAVKAHRLIAFKGPTAAQTITAVTTAGAAQALVVTKTIYKTLGPVTTSGAPQALSQFYPHQDVQINPVTTIGTPASIVPWALRPVTTAGVAQSLSFTQAPTYDLTPVTTSGAAQALSVTKTIYKTLAPVTTSGSVQPLSTNALLSLTPVETSGAAQTLTVTKPIHKTLGAVVTQGTAQGVAPSKVTTLVPVATEGIPGIILLKHEITPVITSGQAQPLSVVGAHSLGPVTVSGAPQSLNVTKTIYKTLGVVTTAGAVQALTADKNISISAVPVSGSVQPVTFSQAQTYSLTPVTTAGAVQTLAVTKTIYKTLVSVQTNGQARVLSISRPGVYALTPVQVAGQAQALSVTHVHYISLSPVTTSGDAQSVTGQKVVNLSAVVTSGVAQTFTRYKVATITFVTGVSAVLPLGVTKTIYKTLTPVFVESIVIHIGVVIPFLGDTPVAVVTSTRPTATITHEHPEGPSASGKPIVEDLEKA